MSEDIEQYLQEIVDGIERSRAVGDPIARSIYNHMLGLVERVPARPSATIEPGRGVGQVMVPAHLSGKRDHVEVEIVLGDGGRLTYTGRLTDERRRALEQLLRDFGLTGMIHIGPVNLVLD